MWCISFFRLVRQSVCYSQQSPNDYQVMVARYRRLQRRPQGKSYLRERITLCKRTLPLCHVRYRIEIKYTF